MLAERFTAQGLSGPPVEDPVAVAARLLAVQGQDPRGFRLAIRARTQGASAEEVDRALTAERSLVVSWLNRGTLHLVRAEDYPWLQELTARRSLQPTARRLQQEGLSEATVERGVGVIERALAENGPLIRAQLGEHLESAGIPTAGQALINLLAFACLRGLAVRGPLAGGEHAYVLVRDWLGGEPAAVDRPVALAELARRYLAGHGPASDRDLARWSGLALGEVRAGLKAIAAELVERHDGLVDLAGRSRLAELPPTRLLGAFDPVLLGWTSREEILDGHASAVIAGGIFRPFALVEGRVAATWRLSKGKVELKPLVDFTPAQSRALERDAADVERFLGLWSRPRRSG